ncbi:MAG: iron ABC transporter permease [Clostridiales bacterium]|jgi:iron complex transport system permease protein|nr:iron ABC transporter permease [Clostridiales bacterium]
MNLLQKFFIQINSNKKKDNKNSKSYNISVIAFLTVLLIIGILLSISVGSSKIPLSNIISSLKQGDTSQNSYRIIMYVRIPRTLAAVLAGCAFAVSGVILQSVLNNSLASPSIIGVNSGAGLFTILVAAFFPTNLYLTTIAAFAGAIIAVLLVYFIAHKTGASRMGIILSGVAVSSFIGAIIDTILTLKPDTVIARTAFLIGGFSGITMDKLRFAGVIIIIAFVIALILSYDMNILALGDETSKSLGLNVAGIRFTFLILAAVLAGSAISFTGLIGFVGLIIPHVSRLFVGYDNRILLPVSALLGSIFTLICDLLARVLFAPYEIPVGIVLSFLGGPFFIYLLLKGKRGQLYD